MSDTTCCHCTPRLWGLSDLAAYIGCSDAGAVTRLSGFPPAWTLPGVRGPRWHPANVTAFFASPPRSSAPDETDDAEPLRLPRISVAAITAATGVG
jgi:hypothetical protein